MKYPLSEVIMTKYLNLGGNSGISSYEYGPGYIEVTFKDGAIYLYDETRPGAAEVETMQQLADSGRGLNSYISRRIRSNFSSKR